MDRLHPGPYLRRLRFAHILLIFFLITAALTLYVLSGSSIGDVAESTLPPLWPTWTLEKTPTGDSNIPSLETSPSEIPDNTQSIEVTRYRMHRFPAIVKQGDPTQLQHFEEFPKTYDYGLTNYNYTHCAADCVQKLHYDPKAYMLFNQTGVRIVWHVWLPSNTHGRAIFLGQLYHLLAPHGLLDRPNTHLYIVLMTNTQAELNWFFNLDIFKNRENLPQDAKPRNFDISVFQTSDNAYEFWAIRWLWELACEHPHDIFLYFHTKGTSYGKNTPQVIGNRVVFEVILSRQNLRPWRSILSIFASTDEPMISWTGGQNMTWFNFFWMRGEYVQNLFKPVRTDDRFWYERWNGQRIKESQCDGSMNLEAARSEAKVDVTKNQYSNGRDSLWTWNPKPVFATKECKPWPGGKQYMIDAIYQKQWAPPWCVKVNWCDVHEQPWEQKKNL